MSAGARSRLRAQLDGVVQGVGFRPFVHRLAGEHSLHGWVRNDERGVLLEVEGDPASLERFLARLTAEAPPLAVLERVHSSRLAPTGEIGFRIEDSAPAATRAALVSADVAPCAECLAELADPADRRYRYPFINCTNCGPRFTIVLGVPYDRSRTTMSGFQMCADCREEYEDPNSRRFHAQPNACPACGPTLRLLDAQGARTVSQDPLASAAEALRAGQILAIKGIGGYQLACRADEERVVAELRRRKRRDEKPFALMSATAAALRELVVLGEGDLELVSSARRPILLAPRAEGAPIAASVAPGMADLGVMLPSSPLHELLLADTGTTLVMTSGNLGDDPLAFEDADAQARLGRLADLMLAHDRPIGARADDSLLRARPAGPALMLRRARGYVPAPTSLPTPAPPLLACGAELKSTFCVANGSRAWVGPHVGDLRNWETLRAFREGIAHFEELFDVDPVIVAHDLHPDYLSTRYACEREEVQLVPVQHHHAHFAAVLAEHGERGPAVGAIYDGAGLGADGTVWGGELLVGNLTQVRRGGHLHQVGLPGGDAAAREPWRMACAWLAEAEEGSAVMPAHLAREIDPARWEQLTRLAADRTFSPLTSSVGRLFDAVAALCSLRTESREEGRAAAELEALADPRELLAYPLELVPGEVLELDPRVTIQAILAELAARVAPALISARFHNGLAATSVAALAQLAEREGVRTAVLAGGVFQNRLLLERCVEGLELKGLRVLLARELPPNDGAISYGQAAVAAASLRT